jgi:hypothetical protein
MAGLEIIRGKGNPVGLIADRRLCLAKDEATLAEDGSPEAAYLLAAEGGSISADVVTRLGLTMVDGRVVQAKAEPAKVEPVAKPVRPAPIPPPDSEEIFGKPAKRSRGA